jgi:hypothetical protein
MVRDVSRGSVCGVRFIFRVPLMWVGPGMMSGAEALEPEIKRSPMKVSHVASKSASAWDWTVKYGKAPFSSSSHRGGFLRAGQSARTMGLGLEFSLVLQLLSKKWLTYW